MKTTPRSEAEARNASRRDLLPPGWYDGVITDSIERVSQRGNDTIHLIVTVADAEGGFRTLRDWLNNTDHGAAKLRHACETIHALERYDAGNITADDFIGRRCKVRVGIRKQRGLRDQNEILDYAPDGELPMRTLRAVT